MARPGRHRRGGRTASKGTRLLGEGGRQLYPVEDDLGELDLLVGIRARLATGEPLDVLSEVSGLITVADPRKQSPMERSRKTGGVTLEELVDSFADVDRLETTALLAGIAHLGFNEMVRRRARRALGSRHHALPRWLEQLGESEAYRAVEMVHVLGDGDNLIIGVRLPGGHELSFVVYIDHNMGTVAKDGFVVPGSADELIGLMKAHSEAPADTYWRELSLADARTRVDDAIAQGAMVFPPLESETWPVCRPLVEWAVRLLPDSGVGYQRPEWSDTDREELTEAFFSSRFADQLHGESYRDLFESILWFGCDYGPGDPLRWSPVSVEIVLSDWIPRQIVAGVGFLSKAPELLRSFIRYAHDVRGIPAGLTEETLAAVDEWEPEYQRLIRTPRPQGPYALLAAMGAVDPDGPWDMADLHEIDGRDPSEIMLDSLTRHVGGEKALWALGTGPLPDEDFLWDGIADDIRPAVAEILGWCDRACDVMLDVEYRTACRRYLAMVARGDPQVFRRRARAETAAAAVCWTIGKGNDLFTPMGGGMLVKDLAAFFGIAQSGAGQRAGTLLKAAGISSDYNYASWDIALGTPDLLVSRRRSRIIELRDRYSEQRGSSESHL